MSTPVNKASPSPHDRGGQYIQPVTMEYFHIKNSASTSVLEAGHTEGGSQIRLMSGMSWHSLHTGPSSLLPWPFCALSQWLWRRQRKKLSDCHRTGHMSVDYGEFPPMLAPLWVVVWWWLSLYSAYSARLILISPPRAFSHQFSQCAFPKALISKGKLLATAHESM